MVSKGVGDTKAARDDYMMFEFKITPCTRADHHNWKHCPHRHPGEVAAQRRHPSVHKPAFCMNLKLYGSCAAGDDCPFSHNTFEMSLHPERYKTTLCNLGDKCNREICFFAHSTEDLRTPDVSAPLLTSTVPPSAATTATNAGMACGVPSFQQQGMQPQQQQQQQQGMQQLMLEQQLQFDYAVQQQQQLQAQLQQQARAQQANELVLARGQLLLAAQQQQGIAGHRGESFSSQASSASFMSGVGLLRSGAAGAAGSLPVSPLLDRSAQSFTFTERSGGSFTTALGMVGERPHSFSLGDRLPVATLLGLDQQQQAGGPAPFRPIMEGGVVCDDATLLQQQQHAAAAGGGAFLVERSSASFPVLERPVGLLDGVSLVDRTSHTQRSFTLGQRPQLLLASGSWAQEGAAGAGGGLAVQGLTLDAGQGGSYQMPGSSLQQGGLFAQQQPQQQQQAAPKSFLSSLW